MGARVFVVQWLARTALLLLWSLAAWGALLLLLTLVDAVGEGLGPALARLLPAARRLGVGVAQRALGRAGGGGGARRGGPRLGQPPSGARRPLPPAREAT